MKTELFTIAKHKGLSKNMLLPRLQLCQGNLDWGQWKVREMSGNFVLSSLYEPCKVRTALCAASELPGEGPTYVEDAPAPAF